MPLFQWFLMIKNHVINVSAKEVLTRHDLQTFHEDLDQRLKKVLPFYEQGQYAENVPTVVAINEALELTKTFSSDKSRKFINGALGKFEKQVNTNN